MNDPQCHQLLNALHRYVDGECPPRERTDVEVHLAACPECRLTVRLLRREADLLGSATGHGEPPADLFDRVAARLPSRRGLFLIRHRTALVAAAAVAALAVVATLVGGALRGRPAPVAVAYATGEPLARLGDGAPWQALRAERRDLQPGTILRAQPGRVAELSFEDWTQLTLRGDSRLVVLGRRGRLMHHWRLEQGELRVDFGQEGVRIDTAAGSIASLAGRGGCVLVSVSGPPLAQARSLWHGLDPWPSAHAAQPDAMPRTRVIAERGPVRVWNRYGSVVLESGMETQLEPGRLPRPARAADLVVALAWTQAARDDTSPVPASPLPSGPPPAPAHGASFEESKVEGPALVPPRIHIPTPGPPPIAVETLEGPPPGKPTKVRASVLPGSSVEIRWEAPRGRAAAIAYKIYRKPKDEHVYKLLTIPPLAAGQPDDTFRYPDHDVVDGMTYVYRVAAVDALSREGPLSDPVTVKPRDFLLSYHGGTADKAIIIVRKRVGASWLHRTFHVHKRNAATGHSGAIGAKVRMALGAGPQTVDFTTGYTLVDVVRAWHEAARAKSWQLLLEDEDGERQTLWQETARNNGP